MGVFHSCAQQVAGCRLQATGYRWRLATYDLRLAAYGLLLVARSSSIAYSILTAVDRTSISPPTHSVLGLPAPARADQLCRGSTRARSRSARTVAPARRRSPGA